MREEKRSFLMVSGGRDDVDRGRDVYSTGIKDKEWAFIGKGIFNLNRTVFE